MGGLFYKYVAKNNVTFVTFVVVGAIVGEQIYGSTMDAVWAYQNKGVSSRSHEH